MLAIEGRLLESGVLLLDLHDNYLTKMKQVFFDANVWIEYCWRKVFRTRKNKSKSNIIQISKLAVRRTALVLSEPLMYEITKHFKDYYLLKKVIADGFSTFQFSRVRRDYKIDIQDKRKVEEIYKLVITTPPARKNMLLDWLNEETFERVFRLINEYHLEMLDCLHVVAAERAGCTIFVTKDEELLDQAASAKKVFRSLRKIQFINPNGFKERYSFLFRK